MIKSKILNRIECKLAVGPSFHGPCNIFNEHNIYQGNVFALLYVLHTQQTRTTQVAWTLLLPIMMDPISSTELYVERYWFLKLFILQ